MYQDYRGYDSIRGCNEGGMMHYYNMCIFINHHIVWNEWYLLWNKNMLAFPLTKYLFVFKCPKHLPVEANIERLEPQFGCPKQIQHTVGLILCGSRSGFASWYEVGLVYWFASIKLDASLHNGNSFGDPPLSPQPPWRLIK